MSARPNIVSPVGEVERTWRPDWPVPVRAMLGQHLRGGGDPTLRLAADPAGPHWRASRTPDGPASLRLVAPPGSGVVEARGWGPGAAWALHQLPDLLGAADDWTGFEPRHPVVADARRRYPHLRLGRSGLLLEALIPAIIEQKVTGKEAFGAFRGLVQRHGERAPGPHPDLWLQPDADTIATIPSWEWLRLGVDPARSRALVRAASHADAIERLFTDEPDQVDRALRSLPGIGVWTSAEVRQRALGDADAVSFGDYHVAKDVGWALTGAPIDDAALHELLEPWRPHRGRVVLLLGAAGHHLPRRGPRLPVRKPAVDT